MRLITGEDVSGIVRRTLSCVDKRVVEHGERVAYMTAKMLQHKGGYTDVEIRNYSFLALIHDIGAYKTEEIDNLIQFETIDVWSHSVYGYLFIKYLSPMPELAPIIFYHHLDYHLLEEMEESLEFIAQIIHIADRMDIYWSNGGVMDERVFLKQYEDIKFSNQIIRLFCDANQSGGLTRRVADGTYLQELYGIIDKSPFTTEVLDKMLAMIVSSIDFRCHITVVHSIVTTSISVKLAKYEGLSEDQIKQVYYGALIHDLGKIGVPIEILDYPGKLDQEDMNIMRNHVKITEHILGGSVEPTITKIALRHHERLNGMGYPNGLTDEELTTSEKLVAVADVISALCEARSYKQAFDKAKTLDILNKQAEAGLLCKKVIRNTIDHFDDIMAYVKEESDPVLQIYDQLNAEFDGLMTRIARKEYKCL